MVDLLESRLEHIRNKGFVPKIIFDIGSYCGDWSLLAKKIFPKSIVHAFEANSDRAEQLTLRADNVHIGVLGDKNKTVDFYQINNTGDSVMQEATKWYEGVTPVKMDMKTVDSLELPSPDLLKIDVQGMELAVLKGGRETFKNTEVIILETKILEYNKGAPSFIKTLKFMDTLDYAPLDITELHYLPSGELNEVDIIFAKKGSALIKTGQLV